MEWNFQEPKSPDQQSPDLVVCFSCHEFGHMQQAPCSIREALQTEYASASREDAFEWLQHLVLQKRHARRG